MVVFYSQKGDDTRCAILTEKILPLIERICGDLHQKWFDEKAVYIKESKSLYEKALENIKQIFAILRQEVVSAGLLENKKIKQLVCITDARFEFRPAKEGAFTEIYNVTGKPESFCSNCELSKETHRVWALPSYVHCLYEAVQRLCSELVELRREDLIADYAEIEYVERYRYVPKPPKKTLQEYFCPNCCWVFNDDSAPKDEMGNPIPFDKLDKNWRHPKCEDLPKDFRMYQERISCTALLLFGLTFYTSLRKFEDHRNLLVYGDKELSEIPSWVAYETLRRIKWAREAQRDYFRAKGLCFKNPSPETCEKSASLLGQHSLWSEVKSVQNQDRNKNKKKRKYTILIGEDHKPLVLPSVKDVPFFLDKDRINKSLALVLKKIGVSPEGISCECEYIFPINIELGFEDKYRLCLSIEWAPGIFEILHLHLFQASDTNIRYDFIKELYENPQMLINNSLDEFGINAKQYLERIGITGVLDKLFIAEKMKTGAILRAKRIDLTKESAGTRKKIRKHTQGLNTVVWRHYSF